MHQATGSQSLVCTVCTRGISHLSHQILLYNFEYIICENGLDFHYNMLYEMLYDWLCICYKGLDYVLFKVIFFVYNMIPTQDVTFILPVSETLCIFKTSCISP